MKILKPKISKKLLFLPLTLALLGTAMFTPVANAEENLIPDPVLAKCIRDKMNLPAENPIGKKELDSLETLVCHKPTLRSISGLEHAHNLHTLYLSWSKVSDLAPLTKLKNLRVLDLAETSITDLSALSGLTGLEDLFLSKNQIRNLDPLKDLVNLRRLYLNETQVYDISALANLSNLTTLHLHKNNVSSITPLANLTNLRELSLYETQVKDIESLKNLTKLEELNLARTYVADLTPLQNLNNLSVLLLADTQVADIAPLASLTKLSKLDLGNTKVNKINALANLKALRILLLSDIPLKDITPLAQLHSLEELELWYTQVSDLSAVKNLVNLTKLDLDSTPISSITPLANLSNLKDLHLRGTLLKDISPLQKLTGLNKLDIAGNQIRDFHYLAAHPHLDNYDLYPQFALFTLDLPTYQSGLRVDFSIKQFNKKELEAATIITPNGEKVTPISDRYVLLEREENLVSKTNDKYTVTFNSEDSYNKLLKQPHAFAENKYYQIAIIGKKQPVTPQPGPGGSGSVPNQPNTPGVKYTFTDIANYPFAKEIEWLASTGITTGYPDRTFRPHDSVSRAAMAAFLYRLEGKPDYNAPAKSPFKDIKPGDDFYKEICWLASKGITTGYADGTFKPWDPIARDAMAAFLHRYDTKVATKKLPLKLAAKKFTDTAATPFAKDIAWLSQTGVTTGYADGSFRPFENIERGAIAAFFYRMKH